MNSNEYLVCTSYPWHLDLSIPGMWSWRGAIFKKYMGFMPTPEEINLPATDAFFNPEYICESKCTTSSLRVIDYTFAHHGRKIRRNEKRWKNYVLPRIAELRAADQWTEGCDVNGQPFQSSWCVSLEGA
jgi:hypothetical protein